ncbi:hypothetical protein AVEN_158673-1, partial [Araneus ventricosus]
MVCVTGVSHVLCEFQAGPMCTQRRTHRDGWQLVSWCSQLAMVVRVARGCTTR